MRKSTSLQIKQHLNYVRKAYAEGEVPLEYAISVITSYLGLLKHTDCDALKKKLCKDFILVRNKEPKELKAWSPEREIF